MNISELVGKRCLIVKNFSNEMPEEVLIEAISDDGAFFKMRRTNGFVNWYNVSEYNVVSTLSKMTLNEYINDPLHRQTQMIFD